MAKIRLGLNRSVEVLGGNVKIVSGASRFNAPLSQIQGMHVERRFFRGWSLVINTGGVQKIMKFDTEKQANKVKSFINEHR